MMFFTAFYKFRTFCNRLYSHPWVQHGMLPQNAMTRFKLVRIKYSLKSVRVNLPPAPFIIRSHIFCPFYLPHFPPPQYFCYIQKKMVNSVGRDVRGVTIATCPSVRPSTSQYGINIATTGVRCSFQHHCYVAPCISCLSLLFLIHFNICVCKKQHPVSGNQTDGNPPQDSIFCYETYSWFI